MARTACLVCFINIVNGHSKKRKDKANALEDLALVAGTQQNLSNLYSLDIYGLTSKIHIQATQIAMLPKHKLSKKPFLAALVVEIFL
jgi:hypothetical protein